MMPRSQELNHKPLTWSLKEITWTKDCKHAVLNISMLKYGKRIMKRAGIREKGHREPSAGLVQEHTRTLLAAGGTRTGSILALPTMSIFLIYKWGIGFAPNSALKLLNSVILPIQHMLFFCAIFKRRCNLVKLCAHIYMLGTISSMLNVQYYLPFYLRLFSLQSALQCTLNPRPIFDSLN